MIVNATSSSLPFADDIFHAVVTSPPYWGGLREYSGTQERLWPRISYAPMPGLPEIVIPALSVGLGLEPDIFAYIGHLVHVFRECRRVLREDGVLVVNIGDTYTGSRCGTQGNGQRSGRWFTRQRNSDVRAAGVERKNLVLQPWRLALALQADGWILRSRLPGGDMEPDIIWHKPTCVPLTARDRPTVDFEDVLVFSQKPVYFWDHVTGMEPTTGRTNWKAAPGAAQNRPVKGDPSNGIYGWGSEPVARRNMRTLWTIPAEPTNEQHYAAFPTELAARMIRVATSERGCCPECRAPWVRQVQRQRCLDGQPVDGLGSFDTGTGSPTCGAQGIGHWRFRTEIQDLGWLPGCNHGRDPVPCSVLDPFAGLGRTWEACRAKGRRFAGVDLSAEYCYLARSRNELIAMRRRKEAEGPKTITGPLFQSRTSKN